MPLLDLLNLAVGLTETRPLLAFLEDRMAEGETHRSAHLRSVNFMHEDNDAILALLSVQLHGSGLGNVAGVTSELDDSDLHTETDAKEGSILFSRPFCRCDHAFCASLCKPTRDQDAVCTLCGRQVVCYQVWSTLRDERIRPR
jgi:hypothetical protein